MYRVGSRLSRFSLVFRGAMSMPTWLILREKAVAFARSSARWLYAPLIIQWHSSDICVFCAELSDRKIIYRLDTLLKQLCTCLFVGLPKVHGLDLVETGEVHSVGYKSQNSERTKLTKNHCHDSNILYQIYYINFISDSNRYKFSAISSYSSLSLQRHYLFYYYCDFYSSERCFNNESSLIPIVPIKSNERGILSCLIRFRYTIRTART